MMLPLNDCPPLAGEVASSLFPPSPHSVGLQEMTSCP